MIVMIFVFPAIRFKFDQFSNLVATLDFKSYVIAVRLTVLSTLSSYVVVVPETLGIIPSS